MSVGHSGFQTRASIDSIPSGGIRHRRHSSAPTREKAVVLSSCCSASGLCLSSVRMRTKEGRRLDAPTALLLLGSGSIKKTSYARAASMAPGPVYLFAGDHHSAPNQLFLCRKRGTTGQLMREPLKESVQSLSCPWGPYSVHTYRCNVLESLRWSGLPKSWASSLSGREKDLRAFGLRLRWSRSLTYNR